MDEQVLTLVEASTQLSSEELSSLSLTQLLLAKSKRTQNDLNAYIKLFEESALRAAIDSDERSRNNRRLSPLDGICIAIKDLFDIAGKETTGGSLAYRGIIPKEDAFAVKLLRQAGAVIMGKTNTDELGVGACTDTSFSGVTRNPWDLTRVPGGSSGGSAVAVSAGLALGAIGSDTGGSIRDPASMCGITGFKPTFGLVSRTGMISFSRSLDHVGVLARTAKDCALLFSTITGYDHADSDSIRWEKAAQDIQKDSQGLRVAIIPKFVEDAEEDVGGNFEESVEILRSLGAEIGEEDIFRDLELRDPVANYEFALTHRALYEKHPEAFGDRVSQMLQRSRKIPYEKYLQGLKTRKMIEEIVTNRMNKWDLLICPTSPITAEEIGVKDKVNHRTRNTFWFNLSRQPTISLPNGFTKTGMPTSLMMAGKKSEDWVVLGAANAFQSVTKYHLKCPPNLSVKYQ